MSSFALLGLTSRTPRQVGSCSLPGRAGADTQTPPPLPPPTRQSPVLLSLPLSDMVILVKVLVEKKKHGGLGRDIRLFPIARVPTTLHGVQELGTPLLPPPRVCVIDSLSKLLIYISLFVFISFTCLFFLPHIRGTFSNPPSTY